MSIFRIAHLSDPHLHWSMPKGTELLGKRALSLISWLRRRRREHRKDVADCLLADLKLAKPDVIALTGDVINFGLPREFQASRQWLEALGSPDRLLVVPGNHEALAGAWHEAMTKAWGPYAPTLPQMTTYQDRSVAIVQVSTAISTPPGMASGRLDNLAKTAGLLSEARSRGLCPVVLMHHSPTRITSSRRDGPDARLARSGSRPRFVERRDGCRSYPLPDS